jgi:hypothetical protein
MRPSIRLLFDHVTSCDTTKKIARETLTRSLTGIRIVLVTYTTGKSEIRCHLFMTNLLALFFAFLFAGILDLDRGRIHPVLDRDL